MTKANVTDAPAPRSDVVSDAAPQPDDVPVRDIVPTNGVPLVFLTVKNPVSGLAQIVPAELQPVPGPTVVHEISPSTGVPVMQ